MRNLKLYFPNYRDKVGDKPGHSIKPLFLAVISAIGLGLFIFSFYWFFAFSFHTVMGDDLFALYQTQQGNYYSNFWQGLTTLIGFTKYRPVFTGLFSLEIHFFGSNFQAYVIFNILLELANVGLVALIAYKISGQRRLIALCAALAALFIRFNFYYVLQMYGFMEGLALLILLLVIYFSFRAYQLKSPRAFIYPNVFFFLLIFTHERYMVVVGFVFLATLLIPGTFKGILSRFLWSAVPVLILLFNFAIKTFIFKVGFISDAGRPINPLSQTIGFLYDGFLNLIGFNVGPDYLGALNINKTGGVGYVLGFATLLLLVIGAISYFYGRFFPFKKEGLLDWLRGLILFGALFGSLLLSASITNLQEYRWLYSPYIVLVLGFAYLLGCLKNNSLGTGLAVLFLAVSMWSNIYYRDYTSNIFFFWSMSVSDSAKVNIIDKYGAGLADRDFYIVNNGNVSLQNYVFFYNYFFNYYQKTPTVIQVHYAQTIGDIISQNPAVKKLLVFTLIDNHFEDITPAVVATLQQNTTNSALGTPYYDFVSHFHDGKINDDRPFNSPNNRGVLLMDLPNSLGSSSNLTIVSGFEYRYENIKLKPQTYLVFDAAKIYNIGDSATLYVKVTGPEGTPHRFFETELPQAGKDTVNWKDFSVPLPEDLDLEKNVILTFGVESATGDSSADWVGLNHVSLVAP